MSGFMNKRPLIILLAAPVLFFLFGSPSFAMQDDPADEVSVPNIIKEVESQYKDKRNRDSDRIIALYGFFDELYPKAKPAEQKKIVKCIRKGFEIKPPPKNKEFMITGAACLSGMGKGGLDALLKAYDSKSLQPKDRKDQANVQMCKKIKATIVEAIGLTKNTKALKQLYKFLWNDDISIINATCKALSNFNELPVKDKKPIVENLVKVYANINAQAIDVANRKKPEYKQKLIATEVHFNDALQKLTFQSFEEASEWQKWYNNNKGKKKW